MSFDPLIDPTEVRDYTWDWTARLASGETITAATVTGVGCTTAAPTVTGTTVTARVSQAVAPCSATCHITTSTGQQFDDTIRLQVVDL